MKGSGKYIQLYNSIKNVETTHNGHPFGNLDPFRASSKKSKSSNAKFVTKSLSVTKLLKGVKKLPVTVRKCSRRNFAVRMEVRVRLNQACETICLLLSKELFQSNFRQLIYVLPTKVICDYIESNYQKFSQRLAALTSSRSEETADFKKSLVGLAGAVQCPSMTRTGSADKCWIESLKSRGYLFFDRKDLVLDFVPPLVSNPSDVLMIPVYQDLKREFFDIGDSTKAAHFLLDLFQKEVFSLAKTGTIRFTSDLIKSPKLRCECLDSILTEHSMKSVTRTIESRFEWYFDEEKDPKCGNLQQWSRLYLQLYQDALKSSNVEFCCSLKLTLKKLFCQEISVLPYTERSGKFWKAKNTFYTFCDKECCGAYRCKLINTLELN